MESTFFTHEMIVASGITKSDGIKKNLRDMENVLSQYEKSKS